MKANETNHTDLTEFTIRILDSLSWCVLYKGQQITGSMAQQTAAFIVEACNSYYQMRESLQKLEKDNSDCIRTIEREANGWNERIESLQSQNKALKERSDELLEALVIAVIEADSWIHSELDGTSQLDSELAKIEPCKKLLDKYKPAWGIANSLKPQGGAV